MQQFIQDIEALIKSGESEKILALVQSTKDVNKSSAEQYNCNMNEDLEQKVILSLISFFLSLQC
jgi:hypothetical protein